MGLISYTQVQNGQEASANSINDRFGKIYGEFNGNIDSANLKNSAVTREKIAPQSVTSDKISTNRYYDENGWLVNDIGTTKTYSYVYDVANVEIDNGGRRDNLPTIKPPVGRTRDNIIMSVAWYGNYAGHAIPGLESGASDTIAVMLANQYAPAGQSGKLTFNGKIFITAVEKL